MSARLRVSQWLALAFFLSWLALPAGLRAATISGTVKDPSEAVIAEDHVQITGGDLLQLGIKGNTTRTADAELPSAPKKVGLNVYKEILER